MEDLSGMSLNDLMQKEKQLASKEGILNPKDLSGADLSSLSLEELEALEAKMADNSFGTSAKAAGMGFLRGVTGVGQTIGEGVHYLTGGLAGEDPAANKAFFERADAELAADYPNQAGALELGQIAGEIAGISATGAPQAAYKGLGLFAKGGKDLAAKGLVKLFGKRTIRGTSEQISKELAKEGSKKALFEKALKARSAAKRIGGLFGG